MPDDIGTSVIGPGDTTPVLKRTESRPLVAYTFTRCGVNMIEMSRETISTPIGTPSTGTGHTALTALGTSPASLGSHFFR